MNDGSIDGSVASLRSVYCMYISYVKASKSMKTAACLCYIDKDDRPGVETTLNVLYTQIDSKWTSSNKTWRVEFNDNEYHVTIGANLHDANKWHNIDERTYIKPQDNEEYGELVNHLYSWKGQ